MTPAQAGRRPKAVSKVVKPKVCNAEFSDCVPVLGAPTDKISKLYMEGSRQKTLKSAIESRGVSLLEPHGVAKKDLYWLYKLFEIRV